MAEMSILDLLAFPIWLAIFLHAYRSLILNAPCSIYILVDLHLDVFEYHAFPYYWHACRS